MTINSATRAAVGDGVHVSAPYVFINATLILETSITCTELSGKEKGQNFAGAKNLNEILSVLIDINLYLYYYLA